MITTKTWLRKKYSRCATSILRQMTLYDHYMKSHDIIFNIFRTDCWSGRQNIMCVIWRFNAWRFVINRILSRGQFQFRISSSSSSSVLSCTHQDFYTQMLIQNLTHEDAHTRKQHIVYASRVPPTPLLQDSDNDKTRERRRRVEDKDEDKTRRRQDNNETKTERRQERRQR